MARPSAESWWDALMARRTKLTPCDGLGPLEVKKIRAALRQCWHRTHSRRLVVKRCTGGDGYTYCELCHERTPQIKIDHITPCGEVDGGYIRRLFCASKYLQGLCKKCHDLKTKQERFESRLLKEFG